MALTPELSQLIDQYQAGVKTLRAAVVGMSKEQLLARPVAGKMSSLEVVCHISDFEPVYVERMKRVITMDNPSLLGADENEFRAKLGYHHRDLEEELCLVEATRKHMARILKTLHVTDFDRIGTHNERGPMSLRKLLETITKHIDHHVPFITEKRKALGC